MPLVDCGGLMEELAKTPLPFSKKVLVTTRAQRANIMTQWICLLVKPNIFV